ncbi:hypothetical protein ONS96_005281 [Cadophora gregata f. sp. sojae]|nr:hypothetical protein ONS96_005281 [Cadophora gregata f. sp. sojae]
MVSNDEAKTGSSRLVSKNTNQRLVQPPSTPWYDKFCLAYPQYSRTKTEFYASVSELWYLVTHEKTEGIIKPEDFDSFVGGYQHYVAQITRGGSIDKPASNSRSYLAYWMDCIMWSGKSIWNKNRLWSLDVLTSIVKTEGKDAYSMFVVIWEALESNGVMGPLPESWQK